MKSRKKATARELGEAAVRSRIEQKVWNDVAPTDCRIVKFVVFEVVRHQYPCPDPIVSLLRDGNQYAITIEGWGSELDAVKLKMKLLDKTTRPPGLECVTGLGFNAGAATVTVTIDITLNNHSNQYNSRGPRSMARNDKRTITFYDQALGAKRVATVQNITLDPRIDLGNVVEAHRAGVTSVLIGLLSYNPPIPDIIPLVIAPKGQTFYKIIFKDLQKEFDVAELCSRMLGDKLRREPRFSLIRTVGIDPRTNAFVVRVAKFTLIENKEDVYGRMKKQRIRKVHLK